jgi:hypothetical protein
MRIIHSRSALTRILIGIVLGAVLSMAAASSASAAQAGFDSGNNRAWVKVPSHEVAAGVAYGVCMSATAGRIPPSVANRACLNFSNRAKRLAIRSQGVFAELTPPKCRTTKRPPYVSCGAVRIKIGTW